MLNIVFEMFKDAKVDFEKLEKFGFILKNDIYEYKTTLLNDEFTMYIFVDKQGNVTTKLIDNNFNSEYTLHLVEDNVGEFVGKVRQEFKEILLKIKGNCFYYCIFKSEQAQEIIKYIKDKYNCDLEFLWQKFPENAIWRREDSKKWFGVLMLLPKSKLGIDSDEMIEIIDLHATPEKITQLVDNKKYFPGYHMNKKSWFTICLDYSVETNKINKLIDDSFNLAKNK